MEKTRKEMLVHGVPTGLACRGSGGFPASSKGTRVVPWTPQHACNAARTALPVPVPPRARGVTPEAPTGCGHCPPRGPGPAHRQLRPSRGPHAGVPVNGLFSGEMDAVNTSFQNDRLAPPVNQGD